MKTIMMKLGVVLIAALLVSGCASLGSTTLLEKPTAAKFRNADAAMMIAQTALPADQAIWWRGFSDPQVERLVNLALTANLDIAGAEARLAEADAMVQRARADRMPGGGAESSVIQQRQSLEGPIGSFASNAPGFARDQTIFDTAARANWEVDIFGRLSAASRAAISNRTETAALLDGVRIRIAAETADAYISWAAANEQLSVLTAQRDTLRRIAHIVQRRFDVGQAGRIDLDRARGDLARIEASLPWIAIGGEAQRNRLQVLIGGGEIGAAPTTVPAAPILTSLGSPADVLRRRPDVRAAEARVAGSDARIASALAEYYPSLSIGGLIGFQSLDADRLFSGPSLNAQGLIGLRWRLFDFSRIDAEVAAARARGDGALAGYRAALLLATEDVENALFAIVAREQQLGDASRASAALRDAARSTQRTFEAGIIGLPAMLAAEQRLLEARQEELSARLARARAALTVFRAIGGTVNAGTP